MCVCVCVCVHVRTCVCTCVCGEQTQCLSLAVITDIASLVMGYDMRRLNDITAFRRYWYRTSLVEALFIGSKKPKEETTPTQAEGSEMIGTPPSTSGEESSAGTIPLGRFWCFLCGIRRYMYHAELEAWNITSVLGCPRSPL